MMVGRDLTDMFVRQSHEAGEVVLSVRHLTSDDVADITFDVRAGEVVGIAGLVGAGRSELAQAIVGDEPVAAGSVLIGGRWCASAARETPFAPASGSRRRNARPRRC